MEILENVIRNGGYLGPLAVSFVAPAEYSAFSSNWSPVVVRLDPQVDVRPSEVAFEAASELDLRSRVARARRRLMTDLTGEFANAYDDLLQELAR